MSRFNESPYCGAAEYAREDAERDRLQLADERREEMQAHEDPWLTPGASARRERRWQAHLAATAHALEEALPATPGRAIGRGQITGEEYAQRATMLRANGQYWLDHHDQEEFVISQSYAWQGAA